MNLFSADDNLLPYDGSVIYYGKIFNKETSDYYFKELLNQIPWQNDEAIMFGKHIITKRKIAWYAENNISYSYSNILKTGLPFNNLLLEIKNIVEDKLKENFNSCLLNLYHNNTEGMAYHSDNEKDLKPMASIASISFGAERMFYFKHKTTKDKISVFLEHGSLLVMKDETQKNWLHRLPPIKKVCKERINLTFRIMNA